MSLTFGKLRAGEITFGNLRVAKMYFGNRLFWQSGPIVDPIDNTCIVEFNYDDNTKILSWNVYASDGVTILNTNAKNYTLNLRNSNGTTIYNEKHSWINRQFSMEGYEDGAYNVRLDVYGFYGGESLWKPWYGFDFNVGELLELLFDDDGFIYVEYIPENDIKVSQIINFTNNSLFASYNAYTQIFNDYGFCVYSSWRESSKYSVTTFTKGEQTYYKETHTLMEDVTLLAGEKYWISSIGNVHGFHSVGYYNKSCTNYKRLQYPIENPVVTTIDPEATFLGEITNVDDLMALKKPENEGSYFFYNGPSFKCPTPSFDFGKGYYTIAGEGSFRGTYPYSTDDVSKYISNPVVGDVASIIWPHQESYGRYYSVYKGYNWTNPWDGNNYTDLAFEPLEGFYPLLYNAEVHNDRKYPMEVI